MIKPEIAAQPAPDLLSAAVVAEPYSFERDHCRSRPVFHVELAQNMFNVFADGSRLCAKNDADIVVAFSL